MGQNFAVANLILYGTDLWLVLPVQAYLMA